MPGPYEGSRLLGGGGLLGQFVPADVESARQTLGYGLGVDPSQVPEEEIVDLLLGSQRPVVGQEVIPPPPPEPPSTSVHAAKQQTPFQRLDPSLQESMRQTAAPPRPAAIDPSGVRFAGSTPQAQRPGAGLSIQSIESAYQRLRALPGQFRTEIGHSTEKLQQAGQKVQESVQQQANVESETAQAQAGILRGGIEAFKTVQAEEQKKVATAQKNIEASFGRYQEAMANLSSMQVDPQRRYKGSAKIGAAIGIMLGAVGAGLAGGRNTALDVIQKEIDRDIHAQMAAIEKQRGVVTAAQTEFGMARQLFSDEESQKLAAENAYWQNVKNRMTLQTLESKSPIIQANAQQALADIDMKIATNDRQLLENQFQLELRGRTAELGAAQAVVGAKAKLAAGKPRELAPPGLTAIGQPTKDDRKEAVKFLGDFNRAKATVLELRKWRDKHGPWVVEDSPAHRKGKALTSRAVIALKRADEMGANFTEMEKQLLSLADDPGEWGFYMATLDTIVDSLDREANAFLRPRSYTLGSSALQGRMERVSQ